MGQEWTDNNDGQRPVVRVSETVLDVVVGILIFTALLGPLCFLLALEVWGGGSL